VKAPGLLSTLFAGAVLAACSGDDDTEPRAQSVPDKQPPAAPEAPAVGDAGPVHVHALGLNPADRALFLATHTGLFRQPRPGAKPRRVAGRWQDTMGFTVIGPDRFLASGHPDGREGLPAFLGLIESTDAGRSWEPLSLQGEMDFHVLEAAGPRIYGFGADWETRGERLLVSDDRGRSWHERPAPEVLVDLEVDPGDADRAVAASRYGLHLTSDAGRSWRPLPGEPGLLAWTKGGLYSVDSEGVVRVARHDLSRAEALRGVGGEPAAFDAASPRHLYVALHDGTIKRSADGGRSWRVGVPMRRSDNGGDGRSRRESAQGRGARRFKRRSEAFRRRCEALRDLACGRQTRSDLPGPAAESLARK
jgi:hypothetical protein